MCRKALDEVDAAHGVVVPIPVLRHWLLVEFCGHLLPFSGSYSFWHHGEPFTFCSLGTEKFVSMGFLNDSIRCNSRDGEGQTCVVLTLCLKSLSGLGYERESILYGRVLSVVYILLELEWVNDKFIHVDFENVYYPNLRTHRSSTISFRSSMREPL